MSTGYFRCAAFCCVTGRDAKDGLKGRCSTTELRPCFLITSYIEKSYNASNTSTVTRTCRGVTFGVTS
jgi:hypothetical protein